MADFTKLTFIKLEQLTTYNTLIQKYVDDADAKSLKSISIDTEAHKVYFYREEEPVGTATPAYTLDLSGYDSAIKDINDALDVINGADTKDGSIAKAKKDVLDIIGSIPVGEDSQPVASTVIGYVEAKVSEINGDAEALEGRVDDIEELIGTIAEGKTVASTISDAIDTAEDYTDTEVKKVTDFIGTMPKETVEGEQVNVASTVIGYIDKKDTAISGALATEKGRIDTLVGDDANKSARTIANEELAKQLIPANAKEALDTLTEIANWIQAHPDDASAMNDAITALQTLVGTIPTSVKDGETEATPDYANVVAMIQALNTAMDGRVDSLESAVGNGGDIDTRISNAIDALDYTDNVVGDIVTSVSEENGVIAVTKATLTFATDAQIKALFGITE